MKTIHVMAGLPRSGSTLLCNLLNQNPNIYSSNTSGLPEFIRRTRETWKNVPLFRSLDEDIYYKKLGNITQAIVQSFYLDREETIIIDKNRSWVHYLEVFEDIKVIAPVRNVQEILASFELVWRNTHQVIGFTAPDGVDMSTLESRADFFASKIAPLGSAYNLLKDALDRGHKDRILFVPYEGLITDPEITMSGIYNFIEENAFAHTYQNIAQNTVEDGRIHGYSGLHKIKSRLEFQPNKALQILGQSLHNKYAGLDFWM